MQARHVEPGSRATSLTAKVGHRWAQARVARQAGAQVGGRTTNSRQLAGLTGPVLVAITLSEIVNPHIWAPVTAPVIYQAGLLSLVAGLSIASVDNRWTIGWPVTITLVGWIGVFGGLYRMFAPHSALEAARNSSAAFAIEIVLLAAGLFLTFKAYGSVSARGK
ncbi:MAG: hypothetical protein WBQ49_10280 [Rhodomicrobium sp.]